MTGEPRVDRQGAVAAELMLRVPFLPMVFAAAATAALIRLA